MTSAASRAPGNVRVIGVCGSLRPGSHTRQAVAVALRGAARLGAQTRLVDLRDFDLLPCAGKMEDAAAPDGVMRLRRELRSAAGVILGTPEYHGGYSGVLKNALDLTGFEEFEGKMVGLVGVSGGALGAANALDALRTVGRALHAWVVPDQCGVAHAWKQFDDDGNPRDPKLAERLERVGAQVARFSALHGSRAYAEFLELWEEAPANPGGD